MDGLLGCTTAAGLSSNLSGTETQKFRVLWRLGTSTDA